MLSRQQIIDIIEAGGTVRWRDGIIRTVSDVPTQEALDASAVTSPGGSVAFADITGDPEDNDALAAALEALESTGGSLLHGTAAPTTEGDDGDFYIRTSTNFIYGPKAGGEWPAGTSIVGPQGAAGTNGTNGADAAQPIFRRVDAGHTVTVASTTLTEVPILTIAANLIEAGAWYEFDGFFSITNASGNSEGAAIEVEYTGTGKLQQMEMVYNKASEADTSIGRANVVLDAIGDFVVAYVGTGRVRISGFFYSGSVVSDLKIKLRRASASSGSSTINASSCYRIRKMPAPLDLP